MNPAFIVFSNQTLPEGRQETQSMMGKSHRSGITHQVIQHPHEGLELGFAHFPLDIIVQRKPDFEGL